MPAHRQTATSGNRRTRAPRGTLSRERIVAAAWAVLRAEGPDGLSMRRIARELGVGTMSLYRHFATRDELIDALTDDASKDVVARAPAGGSWQAQLRELFIGLHGALQEHPEFVELRLRSPILTPEALRFTDRAVSLLMEAGLSPRAAVRAYRTLYFFTFGSAAFARRADRSRDDAKARDALAGLPLGEYPGIARARREVATAAADTGAFEYGLGVILVGLTAHPAQRV